MMSSAFATAARCSKLATLYGVQAYIPMALHTAVCMLVLSFGVFTLHPNGGPARILRDRGPAGSVARALRLRSGRPLALAN